MKSTGGGRLGEEDRVCHKPGTCTSAYSGKSLSVPRHTRPSAQPLPQDSPRPRIPEDMVQERRSGIEIFSSERISIYPGWDAGTGESLMVSL